MKKIACIALLVSMTTGCELFNKPANDDQNQGGDQGGGEPQQGGVDATQYVQAPGTLPICPDAKVGWMVEQKLAQSGTTYVTNVAVVGEAGDSWLVESKNMSIEAMAGSMEGLKGMLLGLTVRKSDGTVTKAVIGKPGEAGKEVKIMQMQTASTEAPAGTPDRVTIALGTFDASKVVHAGGAMTTWTGTSGETKGVLLKSAGSGQDYELAALPSKSTMDIGGVAVPVVETSYTNGMKTSVTDHEIIACLTGAAAGEDGKRWGLAKNESGGIVIEVTSVKTDAAPQLKWE